MNRSQHVIRVIIVDDHALVREAVALGLSKYSDINVVEQAASGEKCMELMSVHHPHIVLMDINMDGMGGLEATRRIVLTHPATRVIVVTMSNNNVYPTRFIQAGAFGYITKDIALDKIAEAIRIVHKGQRYLSADVARQIAFSHLKEGDQNVFDSLSERELQVVLLIVKGIKVQEIADKLSLSPKTVNSYRYRIFEKLHIENDVELTILAIKHGLLEIDTQ